MKTQKILHVFFAVLLLTLLPVPTSAQAPDVIAGRVLDLTIILGTGPFYKSGDVSISFNDSTNFVGVGNEGQTLSGTYAYRPYTDSHASLTLYYPGDYPVTEFLDLNFANPTNGTYSISVSSYPNDYGLGAFLLRPASNTPGPVVLFLPHDDVTFTNRCPYFSWSQTATPSTWFHFYLQRNGSKCVEQWFQNTTWTPPSDLQAGEYTWWVQGWNSYGFGTWSEGYHFTIPAGVPGTLIPSSPVNVELRSSVAYYSWPRDPHATWYQLCVLKNGAPCHDAWYSATSLTNQGMVSHCCKILGGHFSGTYNWWVRGWSPDGMGPWSSTASFTVAKLTPPYILKIYPIGLQTNSSVIRFTWYYQLDTAWYELCVTKNGTVVADKWFAASDSLLDPESGYFAVELPTQGPGDYKWWVRGWNSDGMGPWSGDTSFQMPVPTPAATTLLAPGGVASGPRPTFSWTAVQGATWYNLYLQKDGAKYYSTWVNTNSWTPSFDMPSGLYTWRVQTWNPDGFGPWSSSADFLLFTM